MALPNQDPLVITKLTPLSIVISGGANPTPPTIVTCADAAVGTTITAGENTYLVVEDGDGTNGIKNSTNLANLSSGTTKFCTSHVTNMSATFGENTTFNQAIGDWDTSNVTNMAGMFAGAAAFNQDLSSWNIADVTTYANFNTDANASWVANSAYQPKFEAPPTTVTCADDAVGTTFTAGGSTYLVVENGNGTNRIKNTINLANLSNGTTKFCTSHVTDMRELFKNESTFNGAIGDWDTSKVTTMN